MPTMDEREKKSFDFAGDVTKQLITLSIGILTLCVAFTDKVFSSESAHSFSWLIFTALILFTLSILCGILTLLKLTGIIAKNTSNATSNAAIYDGGMRLFSSFQLITFLLAIVFSMSFVGCSLGKKSTTQKEQQENKTRTDSLYIKVECLESGNSMKNIKHRTKKTPSSCYKYVKINTCIDTILPKSVIQNKE